MNKDEVVWATGPKHIFFLHNYIAMQSIRVLKMREWQMKTILSGKWSKVNQWQWISRLSKVVISHIFFLVDILIVGEGSSWFLPAHDDSDKSSQGILGRANRQITLIKFFLLKKKTQTFPYWKLVLLVIRTLINRKLFISNDTRVEISPETACMLGRLMTLENSYWPRQVCLWSRFGPIRHRHILKRVQYGRNYRITEGISRETRRDLSFKACSCVQILYEPLPDLFQGINRFASPVKWGLQNVTHIVSLGASYNQIMTHIYNMTSQSL